MDLVRINLSRLLYNFSHACSRLLVRHPRVMARLRREILSVLNDGEHPTRDLIRKMPYLALVVKESQNDLQPVPCVQCADSG